MLSEPDGNLKAPQKKMLRASSFQSTFYLEKNPSTNVQFLKKKIIAFFSTEASPRQGENESMICTKLTVPVLRVGMYPS